MIDLQTTKPDYHLTMVSSIPIELFLLQLQDANYEGVREFSGIARPADDPVTISFFHGTKSGVEIQFSINQANFQFDLKENKEENQGVLRGTFTSLKSWGHCSLEPIT